MKIKVEVVKEKKENRDRFLIIITGYKEIFAGWTNDDPKADIITLTDARQVIYYTAETKGLLGLAANGPGKDSRISNVAPSVTIRQPVNVLLASPEAIDRFATIIWK